MTEQLKKIIRDIPNFPREGIIFKDITTLCKDPLSFQRMIDLFSHRYLNKGIDYIVGVEARGFIIGSALAYKLGAGLIPVRKAGKLPHHTYKESYALEYGEDILEIHKDAIEEGKNVLIVDDLLATGGTAEAVCKLVEKCGGNIFELAFLIELKELKGKDNLKGYEVFSMIKY